VKYLTFDYIKQNGLVKLLKQNDHDVHETNNQNIKYNTKFKSLLSSLLTSLPVLESITTVGDWLDCSENVTPI